MPIKVPSAQDSQEWMDHGKYKSKFKNWVEKQPWSGQVTANVFPDEKRWAYFLVTKKKK